MRTSRNDVAMMLHLVQISDLHLGRSFHALGLPAPLTERLRAAGFAAFRRAVERVRELRAAALLIPGDLFDRPQIAEDLYARVRAELEDAAAPVFVAPGNHDAFGPLSIWNNAALQDLGLPPWPEHVHIFTTEQFSSRPLPAAGLVVHGHRVAGYHALDDSPLNRLHLDRGGPANVVLLHGALVGGGAERDTAPFTREQLARLGADYVAIGHYHRFQVIEHGGRTLGAYGGVPVPGERNEDPHGGIAVVRLDEDGAHVELEQTYPGRIATLNVEGHPTFEDTEAAVAAVRQAARAAQLGADDIVYVRLAGLAMQPLDAEQAAGALSQDFAHVHVRDESTYLVEEPPAARITIESQFLARLAEQIAACHDDEQRAALECARRYGLAALRGCDLRPPPALQEPSCAGEDRDEP